ncbi:MAG TPA: bile acid:sodium symporter [Mycobacteriales bacterium]|nr:bile acid:sodium symporter [Mycobacteriales bacterium]
MDQSPLITVGLPLALFVIMVGIGLTLTADDFRREARAPRGVVVGTLAQLLLMPLLGFAVALLLDLPAALAVGLVVAASCPGGSTSNVIAHLARANVALSIVLTVLASLGTILTLPFFVGRALDRWGSEGDLADVAVSLPLDRTLGLLVGVVLLPVAIGMAVRRRSRDRALRLEKAVSAFGGLVLALLIVGIAVSVRDRLGELLAAAGPAALLLNAGGLAVGWLVATGARLPVADRLTTAVELGVKNTTLGLLIAITVLGSDEIAVPSAVYGLLMYVSAGLLIAYGRRRSRVPV